MGLFDGFEAGWNSFKNKELKQAAKWVSDNTDLDEKVTQFATTNPKKASRVIDKPIVSVFEQIYKVKSGKANISPILDDSSSEKITALTQGSSSEKLEVISESIDQGIEESKQPIWERESTEDILGTTAADDLKNSIDQGIEESKQPIWERDSSKKMLGESGADDLQNVFNPARWVENEIDKTPIIPDNTKDAVKTYLPIVALGAGALFLLAALK